MAIKRLNLNLFQLVSSVKKNHQLEIIRFIQSGDSLQTWKTFLSPTNRLRAAYSNTHVGRGNGVKLKRYGLFLYTKSVPIQPIVHISSDIGQLANIAW